MLTFESFAKSWCFNDCLIVDTSAWCLLFVLLEDEQKIGLGVFDRTKIGIILALIPISLCLILGHFPVFNVVKSSVSSLFRPQGHL